MGISTLKISPNYRYANKDHLTRESRVNEPLSNGLKLLTSKILCLKLLS